MGIYLDNGYLDVRKILSYKMPFTFIIGARGIGKTYGSLDYVIETKTKHIMMRRTQNQADQIANWDFSPYKSVCLDKGIELMYKKVSKDVTGVYELDGNIPFGYILALSTFKNIRGFDASDVPLWFYDEFVPESHDRKIKEEGKAFLNAYETIARNRELKGEDPLQVLCASNSEQIGNPIFMELGLVGIAEKMQRKGQEIYINNERGICIIIPRQSPISERKKNTALYKAAKSTQFTKMALENEFDQVTDVNTGSRKLVEYRILCTIGEISIYRHKSDGTYYVSLHRSGAAPEYTLSDADRQRFFRKWNHIWTAYMNNKVYFESSMCEVLFQNAFD